MIVDRRSVEVQSARRKAQRTEKEKGKSFRLFARLRRNKGVNEMERKNKGKKRKREINASSQRGEGYSFLILFREEHFFSRGGGGG